MRGELLIAIFVLLGALAVTPTHALIGANGTNFSSDGYLTTISIYYAEGGHTLGIHEGSGSGGGGGRTLASLLTIKVYDNTTSLPYVEVLDDGVMVENFTMYEKEVASINVTNSSGLVETLINIMDMRGDKSAWINLVDYKCTGNEDIKRFWMYKNGPGFPDAMIFTWLEDCEQLVVPLHVQSFPL
jgi:hypothetical protein